MSYGPAAEIRFDHAAYRVIALTLATAIAIWTWAHGELMQAGIAVSVALLTVFWSDLRKYQVTGLHLYLLFTVVFYSHRYLFKWGDPDSQAFAEAAPAWIRVTKDVVWLLFLAWVAFLWATGKRKLRLRREALVPLLAIAFFAAALVASFARAGDLTTEGILFYLRYPLEYIPAILLAPFLLTDKERIVAAGKAFHALLFVILGFLGYEAATGVDNGFNWGPGIRRYGSIFGSPVDLGMFCVFFLIFLLCLWPQIRLPGPKKLTAALGVSSMLLLTVSFGALLAAVVGLGLWAFLSKGAWRYGLVVGFLLVGAFVVSQAAVFPYLPNRFEDILKGRDASSIDRFYRSQRLLQEINKMSPEDRIIGLRAPLGWMYAAGRHRPVPLEIYYLRVFVGQGVVGVLALLAVGATLTLAHWKAWRSSSDPLLRQVFLACVICTLTMFAAMTTHPRLDMFPTNFYFWLIAGVPLTDFRAR